MRRLSMVNCICRLLFGLMGLVVAGASWSQTVALPADSEFSFTPPKPCTVPPKSPPSALLAKKYKVGNLTNVIYRLDINGDGICDWLREGFSPTRYDEDPTRWEDFLFLGSNQGWRRLKSLTKNEIRNMAEQRSDYWRGSIPPSPVALVVYKKDYPFPYIVLHAPIAVFYGGISLLDIKIGTWNQSYESFENVDLATREKILFYLAQTFCREGIAPEQVAKNFEWTHLQYLITPTHGDSLCRLK